MSFSDRITLQNATPADQHYDAIIKNSNSTIRRDASQPLDQPMALTVSHETSKDKKRISSAVMLDKTKLDSGDNVTLGNARVLFKIQYDVQQITSADLQEMIAEVKEFLSTTNCTKLFNLEH